MNFVLFRFKSRRLCARNAARSTRRKVATNDTKHSERTSLHVPFSATVLDDIVKNVLQNLKENKTHSEVLRLELGLYTWQSLDENGQEYKHIQMLFEGYSKNGSVEKFYAKFYSTIAVHSVK